MRWYKVKRAMRFSKKLKNRFNEITDISEELTMGLAKIIILGNQECMIENYKGIIQYENQKIILKTINGIVSVEGNDLCINEIGEGEMLIRGKITSLTLDE
ncbi:MAG: sporulation protein YqfC [Clostridiales bacterium]|nr:sporulation protein YqfC [Clostridiales bacterium]